MATIYEVSKLAGVSLATVSRVMNKNSNVSEKTRNKVLTAMEQLGYRPNSVAQSLASSRSNCVGILVGQLHGSFYGSMMAGIEGAFRSADKHIVITASNCEEAREKDDIEFLISRNCDALILHVEAVSDEYLINLSRGKTPIVIVNRYIPQIADRCISLDNKMGGYIATKAILDQGHTDIAYIAGPKNKVDAQQRLQGHIHALEEKGLPFNPDKVFYGNYVQTGGSDGFHYFQQQKTPFTAIVCANDEMATGVLASAREAGMKVPDQLSLMGFDNVLFSSYTFPTLSTVNYPITQMGEMAAHIVMNQVYDEKKVEIGHIFEPELVLRESIAAR